MKKTAKILCAFLTVTMLLPSQVLAADIVSGSQTQQQSIVINEVESNGDATDWVEIMNVGTQAVDISGLILKDEKDKDPYTIPEGTKIPANGFLVIGQDDSGANGFAFGLGKGDSVRLFEDGEEIAATTWPEGTQTNPTWGLYPDVNGSTYKNTLEATPGKANKFADIPDVITWPGSGEVRTFDKAPTFLEDSSGLDFANGKIYAVDNGTATFWVMDAAKDGTLRFAKGFEQGKRVCFQKDANNENAKGPDAKVLRWTATVWCILPQSVITAPRV